MLKKLLREVLMGAALLWIACLGLLGLIGLIFGHSGFLIVCILLATPAMWLLWWRAKTLKAQIKSSVVEICGGNLPRFTHIEGQSVVALNEVKNEIVLGINLSGKNEGKLKSYPYEAIRSWKVSEETPEKIVSGYGPGMLAAASANQGAEARARRNTGLFIQVKDIDHPEWRISMVSRNDRNRWFEILNQAINEEGVVA